MNDPKRHSVLFVLWLSAALLASGCASMESGQDAYPTLKDTQMNVDWPMTAYRDAVAQGRVTPGQQQQVNAAYARYQAAFEAAVQAAHSNYKATTPDNVKDLANQLIQAVHAISL